MRGLDITMFTKRIEDQIKKHALKDYPNECCGLIVKTDKGYKYVKCENIAEDTVNNFAIKPDRLLEYDVKCIVHSHCDVEEPEPSGNDIQSQIDCNILFGIVAVRPNKTTSEILYFPVEGIDLIGRDFRNGPSGSDHKGDCYAIIKDFYKQELNTELPEFPRYNEWWKNGENLYLDGFSKAGFKDISEQIKSGKEILKGDVGLMSINSSVPNHAVVMKDNQLMIHHLANRLSRAEPIGRWSKYISYWLRRDVE